MNKRLGLGIVAAAIVLLLGASPQSLADCSAVSVGGLKIEAHSSRVETMITVNGQQAEPFMAVLPDSGPGQECLEMQAFEKPRLVLVQYKTGGAGTKVLVHYQALLAYRVGADGSLRLVRRIDLSEVETRADKQEVIFQKEATFAVVDSTLKITLRDVESGLLENIELR